MYIDPGIGAIVIQALIGGLLMLPFLLKKYWSKVSNVFSRRKARSE